MIFNGQDYWLGTVADEYTVWWAGTGGSLASVPGNYTWSMGIRPVITVLKSKIS